VRVENYGETQLRYTNQKAKKGLRVAYLSWQVREVSTLTHSLSHAWEREWDF